MTLPHALNGSLRKHPLITRYSDWALWDSHLITSPLHQKNKILLSLIFLRRTSLAICLILDSSLAFDLTLSNGRISPRPAGYVYNCICRRLFCQGAVDLSPLRIMLPGIDACVIEMLK